MNNFRNKNFYYEKLSTSAEQQKNMDKIFNDVVNDDKYPNLKQMIGTYKKGLLSVFFATIRAYDSLRKAEIDNRLVVDNLVYRYMYIEHLIEFSGVHLNKKRRKEKRFSRKNIWSVKLNILCTLGLVLKLDIRNIKSTESYKIRKSREKKEDRIDKIRYEKNRLDEAKAKYIRDVNYFAIPIYDDKILSEAEARAKKLIENGYKQSTFSKQIVIDTFSQDFADKVFLDKRKRTSAELERESLVFYVISEQVAENGYTTKESVIQELLFQIDIFEYKQYEALEDIKQDKYNFVCDLFSRTLFQVKKMYDYKPLSKKQKESLCIDINSKRWYIVPKTERKE